MRRFMAGVIGLALLPLIGCAESSTDSAISSTPSVQPTELPDQTSIAVTATTEEDGHHQHEGSGHSHQESHAENSHQSHGQRHAHEHGQHSEGHVTTGIAIGDVVPNFEVTINGTLRTLSELRKDATLTEDGTLVFTFWCSFCHSCRHVEGDLDKLATKYKGQVAVIALDASAGETTETVTEFAARKGLSMPIALSVGGAAAELFGIRKTTTTVVIDSKGVL